MLKTSEFSVLMSVYKNDSVEFITQAIDSVINQTARPNEVVIIVDGPVHQKLKNSLLNYESKVESIILYWLPNNVGLGEALRIGLEKCNYELVARMDSDDISLPTRFEKQLECFQNNSDLSLVGTNISEFIGVPSNIVSYRKVPSTDIEIKKYIRTRSPFNHASVMFKKSDVIKAGNYQHWYLNEDYYLWVRMYLVNCNFMNIEEALLNVRIDQKTFQRRGGWSYFWTQKLIFDYMLKNKIINYYEYIYNNSVRFVSRLMLPNSIRQWIYFRLLRSRN